MNPTQSSDELTQTVEMPTQSGSGKPAKGKDSNAKGLVDVRKNIQLSEKEQALVEVLLNHPDYTQAQIAEDLGWNVNTVKYRMQGSYNMMWLSIRERGAMAYGNW